MSDFRPLELSLPATGAESFGIDVIATASKQSDFLVLPSALGSTYFYDCSAPTTPLFTETSSFVNSAASSVSLSSCSSPTTEFSATGALIEPRMPRLSEEHYHDDCFVDPNTIFPPLPRATQTSLEKAIPSHPSTEFDFAQDDFPLRSQPSVLGMDYQVGEKNGKHNMEDIAAQQQQSHNRHKSGDSSSKNSISSKLIPGFMRRRHRKNSSLSTNPTVDTTRTVSSRSSSFTSTHKHEAEANSSTTSLHRNHSWTGPSPPVSPYEAISFADYAIMEPIDRQGLSPTPLLPPMLGAPSKEDVVQSPLQSPTRAESMQDPSRISADISETQYPQAEVQPLRISAKPSMSSMHHTKRKTGSLTDTIPPFMLSSQDKWSLQLGHANYTICPEPYFPEVLDLASWRQLKEDQSSAHTEYCKHQARTLEHYGPNSRTYRLTEEKWAETDAEWKHTVENVERVLLAKGVKPSHLASATTAPNVRMPTLNPHDGKMPKLGDQNIVGPMAQSPPMQPPARTVSPVRKTQSNKLREFKLGNIFGKGAGEDR